MASKFSVCYRQEVEVTNWKFYSARLLNDLVYDSSSWHKKIMLRFALKSQAWHFRSSLASNQSVLSAVLWLQTSLTGMSERPLFDLIGNLLDYEDTIAAATDESKKFISSTKPSRTKEITDYDVRRLKTFLPCQEESGEPFQMDVTLFFQSRYGLLRHQCNM